MREQHLLKQLHKDLHFVMRKYFSSPEKDSDFLKELLMKLLSLTRHVDLRIKELELKQRNMLFDFQERQEDKEKQA